MHRLAVFALILAFLAAPAKAQPQSFTRFVATL
jgi:hypothetical protein